MSDEADIKKNVDIMRATLNVVEVITPFTPAERLKIIGGAVMLGGCKAILFADIDAAVREDPALRELMAKVKARRDG